MVAKYLIWPRLVNAAIGGALGVFLYISSDAAELRSPSELLARGIEAQENKRDLGSAVALYQTILSETNLPKEIAAQAQYRLGVCYYGQKQYAKATGAFQTFIKEFPDLGDAVQLARQFMGSTVTLLPPPWSDRERMKLEIRRQNGTRIGLLLYWVEAGQENGRKIWKLGSRTFGGIESFSCVEADALSFKPLHSRWKHTLLGYAEAKYSSNSVTVSVKGKDTRTMDLPATVFDNEQVAQLIRRLPLGTNYSVTVSLISSLSKGPLIPLTIEVAGVETLRVPAGQFECFRVNLSLHQTFWVSTDSHRYIVKFQTGMVQAELTGVDQVNATQPVSYQNHEAALSMTAPPGWYFFDADPNGSIARVYLLDPEATAHTWMTVQRRESLIPGMGDSLQAWADHELLEGAIEMKDVYPRKDTWREFNLPGAHALSVVCDFNEARQAKVAYQLVAYAGTNAFLFTSHVPAEDFKAIEPKLQQIVNSLKFQ